MSNIDEEILRARITDPKIAKLAKILMNYGDEEKPGLYVIRSTESCVFCPGKKQIYCADMFWGYPRYVYNNGEYYKENIAGKRISLTRGTLIKNICKNAGHSFDEYDDDGKLITIGSATEAQKVSQCISAARANGEYKNGGNRFDARRQVSVNGTSSDWVQQDANMLFKTGDYLFSVPVHGKTNDYTVTIIILNFLELLNKELKNRQFAVPTFQSAVMQGMNSKDIKVSCQCADWLHRGSYVATVNGVNAGRPENRPAIKTNPQNKEIYCKHILSVLQSKVWAARVARTLFNYIIEVWKSKKLMFDKIIRPALGDITDEKILSKPEKSQTQEVQDSEISSNQTTAQEAVNTYYEGRQVFDEDQEFMLSIVADNGTDIRPYVTPENTPDQILELGEQVNNGTDIGLVQKLAAEPTLPYRTMKVICEASREGTQLYEHRYLSPDVLQQVVRGVKLGVPVDKTALKGFNSRQIEQLIRAYLIDTTLYDKICRTDITYNKMRDIIAGRASI